MIEASIVIPTARGGATLRRAVESCIAQQGIDPARYEIVVVDNCGRIDGASLAAMAPPGGPALRIVVEPNPGVSQARNAGVRTARGRFVLFLDDDQAVTPGWLAALLSAQRALGADIVFGPVDACVEGETALDRDYVERFFSRRYGGPAGLIGTYFGTNGVLVDRQTCIGANDPFDLRMAETGGEDTLFFEALLRAGRRFAWTPDAVACEFVPADRATARYIRQRSFARGQGPSFTAALSDPPRWLSVARWMGIGIGQAIVYGALAAALRPVDAGRSLFWSGRALEGCGKLLWMAPFRARRYRQTKIGFAGGGGSASA